MPTSTTSSSRTKLIPLRDFFRNPETSGFQVSPDGTSLSFMQPYQNRMNVFVHPRAGGEAVRVTSETERDVAGYFWKGSGRIVYLKDFKGDETTTWWPSTPTATISSISRRSRRCAPRSSTIVSITTTK